MDIQRLWEKALRDTEIVRLRLLPLLTFEATDLPYVFLSESLEDSGNTLVRKGKVLVDRPAIWLPSNLPHFEGFDFEKKAGLNPDLFMNFLLVRGVKFPSMNYNNITYSISLFEGNRDKAVHHYQDQFQREENMTSGLVAGPEDCWQFSVLILVGAQMIRSADGDIRRLLEKYQKGENDS